MLKINIIVFPPKLSQILTSLLVRPTYKTHSILVLISEYKKCDLYAVYPIMIYENAYVYE